MKTIRNTAIAAVALMAGLAAEAQATVISASADTSNFASLGGQYIGAGGIVKIMPNQAVDAAAVIDGAVNVDFDFRFQPNHVGLNTVATSNNGLFTLSKDGQNVSFGSHDLTASGGISTDAFDGSLAGGVWMLRLDNPNGGDPWAAFAVTANYNTGAGDVGGNGGGGDNPGGAGGGNGGGGNGGGGGQVPGPAPISLIAAMALFGAWRRKRSTVG